MREIKFRIWSKYCHSYLNQYQGSESIGKWIVGVLNTLIYNRNSDKKDLVFEQYTGLKDANDKEIFEGDILKCPWHFSPDYFSIGYVIFYEGAFHLAKFEEPEYPEFCEYELYGFNDTPTHLYFWKDAEIIGNIHENPQP
jgi:uncharacterized phage protein (TIGR01671 family)